MTKRDIEKALDELGGTTTNASTTREWVNAYIDLSLQGGFEVGYDLSPDDGDTDDVCIMESIGEGSMRIEFFASEEEIPDWVDRDALPVRE